MKSREDVLCELSFDQLMAALSLAGMDRRLRKRLVELVDNGGKSLAKKIHEICAAKEEEDVRGRLNEYLRILGKRPMDGGFKVAYHIYEIQNSLHGTYICYMVYVFDDDMCVLEVNRASHVAISDWWNLSLMVRRMDGDLPKLLDSAHPIFTFPYAENPEKYGDACPERLAESAAKFIKMYLPRWDGVVAGSLARSIRSMREHEKAKPEQISFITRLAELLNISEKDLFVTNEGIVIWNTWPAGKPVILVKNRLGEYYKVSNTNSNLSRQYDLMRQMRG